ncbi:MAG: hypothetical protein K9G60_02950 [Pseudolabrys sp.]|nr:hypothetical protein [Pseudolabrys sp.]
MRIVLVTIVAGVCAFGGVSRANAGAYQGDGAYVGSPSPAVTALFAAFPNGGDGLVAGLRALMIDDPTLADDVAFVGAQSNAAQQAAAGDGMAQAVIALVGRGNNVGVARIVNAAQRSGASVIQIAVTNAVGGTIGLNSFQSTNANSGTTCTTTGGTVSPAGPTATTTCQ